MIWRIINVMVLGLKWFFLPPDIVIIRKIDPSVVCPACGHKKGKIHFIVSVRAIEHTCMICGAQWREDPVLIDFEPVAVNSTTAKLSGIPEPSKE